MGGVLRQGGPAVQRLGSRAGVCLPIAAGWMLLRGEGWVGSPDTLRRCARRAGSPYPAAPPVRPQPAKDGAGEKEILLHA